ncbi:MAG TPA: hypothetical protein VGB73_20965 [Pyrinomonadaceae bacterium]|jgi:hypothetical protein
MTSEDWSKLVVAFVLFLVGAQAIHWLTTPVAAAASDARWWAVVAQAVLGIGSGCWFLLKGRRRGLDS